MFRVLKRQIILTCSAFALAFSTPTTSVIARSNLNETQKIFITFDANGGTLIGNKLFEVDINTKFKDLVNPPTVSREGVKTQPGWYFSSTKQEISDETVFTSNCTLKANWKLYDVTFDAKGGLIGDKETKSFKDVTIIHSDELVAPSKENYTFTGWKEEGSEEYITFPYSPTKDVTINACYTHEENVVVAFISNGGKFKDSTNIQYINVPFGSTWNDVTSKGLITFDEPSYNGDKVFSSWKINREEIPSDFTFKSGCLIKASYEDAISVTFDVNSNGGSWNDGTITSKSTKKIKLSTNPSLSDFKKEITYSTPRKDTIELLGWFDNKNADGKALDLDSTAPITNTKSFTIYAYYKDKHNITFNLEGVSHQGEYVTQFIRKDELVFQFKQKDGYTLLSNQIKVSWGGQIKGDDYTFTVIDGVGTLTIQDAPGHDITIDINASINNYSIFKPSPLPDGVKSISVASDADYNKEITMSIELYEGYSLKTFKAVRKDTQKDIPLIDVESGKKFNMPNSDVDIIAEATLNSYNIKKDETVEGIDTFEVPSTALYKSSVTVTTSAKEGYTLGNIKVVKADSPETIVATITSGESFTMPYYDVKVIPSATINSYTLTLDGNGGDVGEKTSLTVDYNMVLLDAISQEITKDPTHNDAAFKGWGESSTTRDIINLEKMPADNKILYAIWYQYNFEFINGDNGKVSGTTKYSNAYVLNPSDFIDKLVITPDEGYSFTNKYEVYVDNGTSPIMTTTLSDALKPGKLTNPVLKDSTIKIKPLFTINKYKISLNYNGGSIKKDGNAIYYINLDYGEKILPELNDVIATHDYKVFKNWEMIKQDGTTSVIDSNTTLPSCNVTIKPVWKSANINIVAENGTITGSSKIENETILYHEEGFGISPNEGYYFHHYEYSFDGVNYTKLDKMPFKPFVLNKDLGDKADVYIKAVCVQNVDIWLFAGEGGTFAGGNNYKYVQVIKGQKWGDIKNTLPTPTKEYATFSKWVDYSTGEEIADDTTITERMILQAIYEGGQ